jgi:uncharacterized protein YkwD
MIKFYSIIGIALLTAMVPMLSVTSNAAQFNWNPIVNPANDIPIPKNSFKDLDAALLAFNNARNQDPTVRNSQKNLVLPPNFANFSWQDQYFFVLNRERSGRGLLSMTYPIPKLNTVAGGYSKILNDNDQFTHTYNGTTPSTRMSADPDIKACIEFQPYSESLYYFSYIGYNFVTDKLVALQGLYNFLYNDAGSNWGHRKHLLSAYQNNNKARNHEGHSGLGLSVKKDNKGYTTYILTHNTFDPNPTCKL